MTKISSSNNKLKIIYNTKYQQQQITITTTTTTTTKQQKSTTTMSTSTTTLLYKAERRLWRVYTYFYDIEKHTYLVFLFGIFNISKVSRHEINIFSAISSFYLSLIVNLNLLRLDILTTCPSCGPSWLNM